MTKRKNILDEIDEISDNELKKMVIKSVKQILNDKDYVKQMVDEYKNYIDEAFEGFTGWEDFVCNDLSSNKLGEVMSCEKLFDYVKDNVNYNNKRKLVKEFRDTLKEYADEDTQSFKFLFDWVRTTMYELGDEIKYKLKNKEITEREINEMKLENVVSKLVHIFFDDLVEKSAFSDVADLLGRYYEKIGYGIDELLESIRD